MSRFAYLDEDERRAHPAIEIVHCDHPEESCTNHDSGGQTCSPTFYCTACNRLVFLPEPDVAGDLADRGGSHV